MYEVVKKTMETMMKVGWMISVKLYEGASETYWITRGLWGWSKRPITKTYWNVLSKISAVDMKLWQKACNGYCG